MGKGISRRTKGNTIFREDLLRLLRQCHLGGALTEATLKIEEGEGIMELIDITNTVTISSKIIVGSDDLECELGLGDLDLLVKFLSTLEDTEITFNNKKKHVMELTTSSGKRRLMYLLTKPELIVTNVEKEYRHMFKKLKSQMNHKIELNDKVIKDILSYISMIKEKGLVLKLSDMILSFVYGNDNEHQFEVVLDKNFDDDESEFTIHLNGEFIGKILSSVEYNNEDRATLAFSSEPDLPIMIKGINTTYFVTPILEVPF